MSVFFKKRSTSDSLKVPQPDLPSADGKFSPDYYPESGSSQQQSMESLSPPYSPVGSFDQSLTSSVSTCLGIREIVDSLNSRRQRYGDNHPKVAVQYNNMGNLHFRRGEFKEAGEAYNSALQIYKIYGRNESVAATLVNIGTLHWRMGVLTEASTVLEEALEIHVEVTGDGTDDHIDVVNTLYSVGIVHFLKGEYSESMEALKRALHGRRNLFGVENIDVSRTIDAMGSVYLRMGRKSKAMKYHMEAFRMKRALLGANHPSIVATIMNLAKVHREYGHYSEAIESYKEALEMQNEALSVDSRMLEDMALTTHIIGDIYMEIGNDVEAMDMFLDSQSKYTLLGIDRNDKRVIALNESMHKTGAVIP